MARKIYVSCILFFLENRGSWALNRNVNKERDQYSLCSAKRGFWASIWIALTEWRAAVETTSGVRLFAAAAHTVTNPKTGEVISMGARDGDTEVFFPDASEWRSVAREVGSIRCTI